MKTVCLACHILAVYFRFVKIKRHTCENLHLDSKDKIREYKLLYINGLYLIFAYSDTTGMIHLDLTPGN